MTDGAGDRSIGGGGLRRAPASAASIVVTVVMIAVAMVWLLPSIMVVLTSLKSPGGIVGKSALLLPIPPDFSNYPSAWVTGHFSAYLLNSLLVVAVKVPLGLLVSAMTAFGLSRFRFRLRKPIFVLIVLGAMVPLQIPLISLFTVYLHIKLLNTLWGLIPLYVAFGLPFQVLFLTSFFNQIPIEIEEAARIDGCGPWRYFLTIVLPLSAPIVASLVILDLVGTWNELGVALTMLLDNSHWTVPLGLLGFRDEFTVNYTGVSAAVVMASIPVMVMYLTLQRYFERGFVAGAVKG